MNAEFRKIGIRRSCFVIKSVRGRGVLTNLWDNSDLREFRMQPDDFGKMQIGGRARAGRYAVDRAYAGFAGKEAMRRRIISAAIELGFDPPPAIFDTSARRKKVAP